MLRLHSTEEMQPAIMNMLQGIFMFVSNEKFFGRLLDVDGVKRDQIHADLWQIKQNPTVVM